VQIISKGREQSDLTYNLQTDCGLTVVGREQSNLMHNSANYQWRKGAERPDLQQCKLWRKGAEWPDLQQCILPVKEGRRATWLTTVQITSEGREQSDLTYNLQTDCGLTVVGREQSDLTYNISHCVADRCWKGAKRPDGQHYLQLCRPL